MSSLTATVVHEGGTLDLRSAYSDPNGFGLAVTDPENLINPGGRTWKRKMVSGNFSHGAVQTDAILDVQSLTFKVVIIQPTPAWVQNNITQLVNAVSDFTWELHVTVDEVEYAWECFCADIQVVMNRKFVHANAPEVTIVTQRQPIALAGPI